MTKKTMADLVAAIQWLKNKHAANQYALGCMAECSAHEDHEIDHLEAILQAVVSGTLTQRVNAKEGNE